MGNALGMLVLSWLSLVDRVWKQSSATLLMSLCPKQGHTQSSVVIPPFKPRKLQEHKMGLAIPPPPELVAKAVLELGMRALDFNIAVIGPTGVGKTSFINAVQCRLPNDHEREGAKVRGSEGGQEEEATCTQKYGHPSSRRVVLWELPWEEVDDNYFFRKKLYAYDYIFILSAKRFNKDGFRIAKQATTYKKGFSMVRTMADVAVKDICEVRVGVSPLRASLTLRKAIVETLQEWLDLVGGLDGNFPLFIISNRAFVDAQAYHDNTGTLTHMDEAKVSSLLAQFLLDHDYSLSPMQSNL